MIAYTDRARDKRSNSIVAAKKVRMERESSGMPISSIREVTLLRRVHHKNIVNVVDMASGSALDRYVCVLL